MVASHPDPAPPVNPGLPAETLPAGEMTPGAARQIMMAEWSTVTTASHEKTLIIRLCGELDAAVRTTLDELLAPLTGTRPDQVVIDLADVAFMDCAAAAVVFEAARRTLPHEEKPVLRAPRPAVLRLLEIAGWDTHCALDLPPGPDESPSQGPQPARDIDRQLHQMHELYERARATRNQSRALAMHNRTVQRQSAETLQRIEAARDRAKQIRELWLTAHPATDLLRYSAMARLQARLASMPLIEQAKGIIMAQCGWPADQAFDALRQASQRENIKVRDLADRIVTETTRPASAQPKPGPPAVKPVGEQAIRVRALAALAATRHEDKVAG